MIQINIPITQKQIHRHRGQTCGCQGGWREEAGRIGVWDEQLPTIVYRMDKSQGPSV